MDSFAFTAGSVIVRQDVFRGRVWSQHAVQVLADDADGLVTACWPGAESLVPRSYAQSLATGDATVRKQAVPTLAAGTWDLVPHRWERTLLLSWLQPGAHYSCYAFLDPADRRLLTWYVNFERPAVRTEHGFDTFDLLVDLVVAPDLSRWDWKDEDEYAQARELGVIGDAEHERVQAARAEVERALAAGGGVFEQAERWSAWAQRLDLGVGLRLPH